MKFFKTTIITYVLLSVCVILCEVVHYSFIRQNFDGFGPGLLAFAMMCFVFPAVSIVIAAIVSSRTPPKSTPPRTLDEPPSKSTDR